jgi:hypothetical protein
MIKKIALLPILVLALLHIACAYIVIPEESGLSAVESKGWSAVATHVGKSETGDLRIELTIRNETADWSAMKAAAGKPALLTSGDGQTTNCDSAHISTGGHRLAPGFQMRGFSAGTKAAPEIQLIYVECKDAEASPGSRLTIDYSYVTGEYNYYYPEENQVTSTLEVDLDQAATD